MKIALSIEALSTNLTGIGRYTLELSRRLASDPAIADLTFYRNGNWSRDTSRFLVNDPIEKSRIGTPQWLRNRQNVWRLRDRVFHGPNYFLPDFVNNGIVTVHDLSVIHFPETHPADRVRHFEREFNSSLKRSAHIITDCQTVRHELLKYTGFPLDRITAVPLGVSPNFGRVPPKSLIDVLKRYDLSAGTYSLCVSTIEPRKKIRELLKSWQELPNAIKRQFSLVVIGGNGWLSDDIKLDMGKCIDAGWLRYLGYVPELDLPSLYQGAALFAYPSAYEGFGLPPIEAMASGVPTIVSNRSCLSEVTQGAAMVVDPDDTRDYANALERGLTDHAWRVQAINHGLAVAARYTWERCAEETKEVYRHVLSNC